MAKHIRWIAASLALVAGSAYAQQATFSGNVLTLPSVQVGSVVYSNVTLGLTNPSNYSFQLTGAGPASPGTSSTVFSGTVLSIPSVQVGNDTYVNVTLGLTNAATYAFILTGATLQQPPTSGNASACLNTAYLAAGTHYVLNYQTSTSGTVNGTSNSDILITGPKTFNGQSAIESQSNTTSTTSVGTVNAQAWSYLQVQNLDVLILGTVVNGSTSGFTTQTTVTFAPPPVWRYSLNAGQSLTTQWNGTSTTSITGTPFPIPPTTSNFSGLDTYEFDGFEDVTVPAGSFSGACKWKHTLTQTVSGQAGSTTTTQWITRKGAMLKSVNGSDVMELTSGTVNGGPVGP